MNERLSARRIRSLGIIEMLIPPKAGNLSPLKRADIHATTAATLLRYYVLDYSRVEFIQQKYRNNVVGVNGGHPYERARPLDGRGWCKPEVTFIMS